VAVDLLRSTDDGFLTGPAAVKDSFEDMKKHVICLLAGMRAAVGATLDGLAPEVAEGRATKGLLKNPGAAAWAEFRQLYADFRHQADDNPDSQINREFRAAYERQLETLDGLRPPG
jgi:predicted component of type VI protein secretion system